LSKKTVVLSLLLAALPAFGQERRAEPPIALYTNFAQPVPTAVFQGLQEELNDLMEPAMIHLEWRSLAGVTGSEVSSELAVVKFVGHCDAEGLAMKSGYPGALGWTHVSDGVILPFADVDCDRIRTFIQKDLLFVHTSEREEVFGRAIARVVAHELYHIFTQTAHHGSDGVGKSAFTVQELLADEFQFQGKEAGMLKIIASRVNPASADHGAGTTTPTTTPPL
jgi:hypothetical protein